MATQHADVPDQKSRQPIMRNGNLSREFATLGNFRSRSFDRPDWIETVGVLDYSARRIVPSAGITVPELG